MDQEGIFTESYYDDIWEPYAAFVRHFRANNPDGLPSFLRVVNLLQRYQTVLHDKALRSTDLPNVDWE